jgi:hypothetical protein
MHDNRCDGQHDDQHDRFFNVLFDEWDLSKEVAEQTHADDPANPSHNVESEELAVVHLRNAGDNGSKGPGERHETSQDNSDPAVFVVKRLCGEQTLAIEKPRLRAIIQCCASLLPDVITRRVANDRG